MATIRDLKPELVWTIFDDITRVPRPSKKEEHIIAFLLDFAKTELLEPNESQTISFSFQQEVADLVSSLSPEAGG